MSLDNFTIAEMEDEIRRRKDDKHKQFVADQLKLQEWLHKVLHETEDQEFRDALERAIRKRGNINHLKDFFNDTMPDSYVIEVGVRYAPQELYPDG